jgi:hypothetical protein
MTPAMRGNRAIGACLLALLLLCARTQIGADGDQDGDGIPDSWETNGVQVSLNGVKKHLNLDGASPRHKDIFVWVAWMEDATHSHKPTQQALDIVEAAFHAAPVHDNPDGKDGIELHVIFANDVFPDLKPLKEQATLGTSPGGDYNWSEFYKLKKQVFPKELEGVFHFCAFIHEMGGQKGASGMSPDIGAYDFIVSLGQFANREGKPVGTNQDQAGTFMHELGHNLGLDHGGADKVNNKPNYLSVMNYLFQMQGLNYKGSDGHFDYSRFAVDFDENSIDTSRGMSNDPALADYGSAFACECNRRGEVILSPHTFPSMTRPHPWCDPQPAQPVFSWDVNGNCETTLLPGQNDWANIHLVASHPARGIGPLTTVPPPRELTPAAAEAVPIAPISGLKGTRVDQNVLLTWTPKGLDRCLAYKIYRRENDQKPVEIGMSTTPAFVDADTEPGVRRSYTVTAVIGSYDVNDVVKLSPNEINALSSLYGAQTQKYSLSEAGGTTSPTRSKAPSKAREHVIRLPMANRETAPSASVTIE